MSATCHTEAPAGGPPILAEGLRLFFPAAALHALVSPLFWIAAYGAGAPFAGDIPAGQWHAHEMLFGTYGAALAGFLSSAVPEWTGTAPRRGRALLVLLAPWLLARLVGLGGFGGFAALMPLAGLADLTFLGLLFWFITRALVARGSRRHTSFALWVGLLWAVELGIRLAWFMERYDLSALLIQAALAIFLIFLSLSIARINVVVVNLALDPSGETSPYRPHPGRQNLTAGLTALYAAAALLLPHSLVPAWLALAAGAAFFDRLAEWFIGRAVLGTHVLAMAAANGFAGAGLIAIGLSGLGAPVSAHAGFHLLAVAGLGLAVLSVFTIAGLRHTGRPLVLPRQAHWAFALMGLSGLVRVLPELGLGEALFGAHYLIAALLWSAAFGVWLSAFLPMLARPGVSAALQ